MYICKGNPIAMHYHRSFSALMMGIKEHASNTTSYLKFKKLANVVKKIVKECLAKLLNRVYHFYNSFNALLTYLASYYQFNLFIYFIKFQLP